MARVSKNMLVTKARGNVGKQFIYKKHGKGTHIAMMPEIDKNAVVSSKQEEVRDSFGAASAYAQGAMALPELKKEYQKKTPDGMTAFNVALKDFLKAPKVKKIHTEKYNGNPGSEIKIIAKDDFRVVGVRVQVHNATGDLVEEGEAVRDTLYLHKWVYKATQTNSVLTGSKITATAVDVPENETRLEITI